MSRKIHCPSCDSYLGEAEIPHSAQGVELVVTDCPHCEYTDD